MTASNWFYKWGVVIVIILLMIAVAVVLYFIFGILPGETASGEVDISNTNISSYLT